MRALREILLWFVDYSYIADDEPTSSDEKMMLALGYQRQNIKSLLYFFSDCDERK